MPEVHPAGQHIVPPHSVYAVRWSRVPSGPLLGGTALPPVAFIVPPAAQHLPSCASVTCLVFAACPSCASHGVWQSCAPCGSCASAIPAMYLAILSLPCVTHVHATLKLNIRHVSVICLKCPSFVCRLSVIYLLMFSHLPERLTPTLKPIIIKP